MCKSIIALILCGVVHLQAYAEAKTEVKAEVKAEALDLGIDHALAYHLGIARYDFKIIWPKGVKEMALQLKCYTKAADGTMSEVSLAGKSKYKSFKELSESSVHILFSQDGRLTEDYHQSIGTSDFDPTLLSGMNRAWPTGLVIGNSIVLKARCKKGAAGETLADMESYLALEYSYVVTVEEK